MPPERTAAIDRGLGFLAGQQFPSGRFPVQMTTVSSDGGLEVIEDVSLFATAQIAHALGEVGERGGPLLAPALTFLRAEMDRGGRWRHWGRESGKHKAIPADLDDMACISRLLTAHGYPIPDIRPVVLANRDREGRFLTWLALRAQPTLSAAWWAAALADANPARLVAFWRHTEAERGDVDGVVNANVLTFLGECPQARPVVSWLREIVQEGREATCDKWYRDPFAFYYAVSRAHRAGVSGLDFAASSARFLCERSMRSDGRIGENILHTALAAKALSNFGASPALLDASRAAILRAQMDTGGWPSHPCYFGGPKLRAWWGSAALTTAFCIEALSDSRIG